MTEQIYPRGWSPKNRRRRIRERKAAIQDLVHRLAEDLEDEYGGDLKAEISAYDDVARFVGDLFRDIKKFRGSLVENLKRNRSADGRTV